MFTYDNHVVNFILWGIIITAGLFGIVYRILIGIGKDPRNILPVDFVNRIRIPLFFLLLSLFGKAAVLSEVFRSESIERWVGHLSTLSMIFSIAWFLIVMVRVIKNQILRKYDINTPDNLKARKVYTQFLVLENIVIFLIVLLAIGIALMSFKSIRSLGVGLLSSAGIAGIIVGFAAQKTLATLLAGIQIAITQPIRLQDVVIVEGEWGEIEEITLTYVVVRIWDKRRLIIPSMYFIENTFQNWSRRSADILGTVFLYLDYKVPVQEIRKEQTRILQGTDLWDGEVNVVQVTETSERTVELRLLVSAINSGTAFDLRALLREKIIDFLQKNYPESLPRFRMSHDHPAASAEN